MPSVEALTVKLTAKVQRVILSKKLGIGCFRIRTFIPTHQTRKIMDWLVVCFLGKPHVFDLKNIWR
jgi:hypothetical protein